MTFLQIFVSIVGIGFFLSGIRLFKETKIWSSITILVGIFLMNQVLFGEISKSDDKQNEIKELQLESISEISILPSQRTESLTKDTLQITSKEEIEKIQRCLSMTKETLKTNRNKDWGCILNIEKTNGLNLLIGISKNENQTILELYSRGEYGTNYGTMRNNKLGIVLEEIIKKQKASDGQSIQR